MDEYDVFLDTASRLKTLELMSEHSLSVKGPIKTQRSKQFVIITPNSVDSIHPTKEIRIHRLDAPQRKRAIGLQQLTIA